MMLGIKDTSRIASCFALPQSRSPVRYSDIVVHMPHFYPHIGAGKKPKTTYVQVQCDFRLFPLVSLHDYNCSQDSQNASAQYLQRCMTDKFL